MKIPNILLVGVMLTSLSVAHADQPLVDLVKKVKPCVVLIETFDKDNKPIGQGSGFFIDNKGRLITNHHVIEGAYSATIKTSAGKEYPVQGIVAKDTEADVVKLVVNLPDANITFLNLSVNVPSEGEDIVVIGNPLGLESSVSTGIVSAVRDIPAFGKIIQITAPISSGSSGSPVINSKGEVIGIATRCVTEGQNLNFAIPSHTILLLKETDQVMSLKDYTIKISDPRQGYFPLVPWSQYIYVGHFNDKSYKEVIRLVDVDMAEDKIDGLCFINEDDAQKIIAGKKTWDSGIYSTKNIGLGVYRRSGTRIYTICIDLLFSQSNKLEYLREQEMLRFPLKVGDRYQFHYPFFGPDGQKILKVISFESVTVPAGRFDRCAKIEVKTTYTSSDENRKIEGTDYAWLAENIGLVKLERKTGRIDELLSYNIPE